MLKQMAAVDYPNGLTYIGKISADKKQTLTLTEYLVIPTKEIDYNLRKISAAYTKNIIPAIPSGGLEEMLSDSSSIEILDITQDDQDTSLGAALLDVIGYAEMPQAGKGISVFDDDEIEIADPMADTRLDMPAIDEEQNYSTPTPSEKVRGTIIALDDDEFMNLEESETEIVLEEEFPDRGLSGSSIISLEPLNTGPNNARDTQKEDYSIASVYSRAQTIASKNQKIVIGKQIAAIHYL